MNATVDKLVPVGPEGNAGLLGDDEYSKFLAERRSCLGGSDAHHLLGIDPFGCRRWLFYAKAGVAPDFPFNGNRHTRRGILLETVAAEEFARVTGRKIKKAAFSRHPLFTYVGAHLDREQQDRGICGVLEVKVPTYFAWRHQLKTGLAGSYRLQVQWGMLTAGLSFGNVWVWSPEEVAGLNFEQEPDQELREQLLTAAGEFWPRVLAARANAATEAIENPYEGPADPHDRRCRGCEYRWKCKGLQQTTTGSDDEQLEVGSVQFSQDQLLDELTRQWRDLKAEAGAAGARLTEVEDAIRAKLANLEKGQGLAGSASRAFFTFYQFNEKARPARTQQRKRLRIIPPIDGPIEAPE